MNAARGAALAGLAGLLLFLPFGIAGQQISLGVGLLGVILFPPARARIRALYGPGGVGRPLLAGVGFWIIALLLALLLSGRMGDGARELRKLYLLGALVLPAGALGSERERRGAAFLLLLALAAAATLGIAEQLRGGGHHPTRLDGPIGFYMTTAGVFLLLTVAAFALTLRRAPLGVLPAAAFLLGAAGVVLTYTRGAWFALAAGGAFLLARRHRKAVLPAILLFGAVLFALPGARERLLSSIDPAYESNRERAWVWEAGVGAFRERPWTGRGLHDLRETLESHRNPEARDRLTHFHSLYLQTAVSMGVPGLAALVALFVAVLASLRRAAARAADDYGRALAEGAIAATLAFLVHGLFEWNLGDSEVAMTLWALVGLGLAAVSGDRDGPPK
ncbi:MAG: O-antigen ligase family protein [Candidatus Eisenbacteria bacterium]